MYVCYWEEHIFFSPHVSRKYLGLGMATEFRKGPSFFFLMTNTYFIIKATKWQISQTSSEIQAHRFEVTSYYNTKEKKEEMA
jgi:hypothetical protein